MARGVNRVELLGNVGKDPDIRTTQSGSIVASFSIATTDGRKDTQGKWQDETTWHNLVAFKRTAEIVRDYIRKGSKLYVTGKITYESWEDKQTHEKKYMTKILVNELILLSGKDEHKQASATAPASNETQPIEDDDIPF
jgi:single-strand DNA-binding protein